MLNTFTVYYCLYKGLCSLVDECFGEALPHLQLTMTLRGDLHTRANTLVICNT